MEIPFNTISSDPSFSKPSETLLVEGISFWIIFLLLFVFLYLYVAISYYKNWRQLHEEFFKRKTIRKAPEQQPILNLSQEQNLALYIPFLPLAVVYLSLRLAWDTFELFVFYSLDSAESGLYLLGHGIKWSAATISKVIANAPFIWRLYIQKPLIQATVGFANWARIHAWPVIKNIWLYFIVAFEKVRHLIKISWNRGIELFEAGWIHILYPLGVFLARTFIKLIIKPVKWAIPRAIYLQKIAWHCLCFLARDLAQDFRDLFIITLQTSIHIWDSALQPLFNCLEKLAIRGYHKAKVLGLSLGKFLYLRLVVAVLSETSWVLYGILRNQNLRFVMRKLHSIIVTGTLLILMKKYISEIIPIITENSRRSALCLAEEAYYSYLEFLSISIWFQQTVIIPCIRALPLIHANLQRISSAAYNSIRINFLKLLHTFWSTFAPLFHPVIAALRIFYSKVILVALLKLFRIVKSLITFGSLHFVRFLKISQDLFFTILAAMDTFYQLIMPYLMAWVLLLCEKSLSLFHTVRDIVNAHFPVVLDTVSVFLSTQVRVLLEISIDAYSRYQPMMIEITDRIVQAVDSAVISTGEAMVEWTKKEKALREAINESIDKKYSQ
ncbi:hypothetical protein G9A89_004250 [Geosiphon pyriformis]|nr:hypothetical protein G9A89_004250 [Geosiphon pyriformis]